MSAVHIISAKAKATNLSLPPTARPFARILSPSDSHSVAPEQYPGCPGVALRDCGGIPQELAWPRRGY
ncbi:MAG TPA: hypothetical protein VGO47_14450 [Chlamydiales bacterium]|nr:hypothetical protein [Chlamydiales bacterium]